MQCPRCLNTDETFLYKGSRGWYCRRCISFGRMMLEEDTAPVKLQDVQEGSEEYALQYPLTPEQQTVSEQCASFIQDSDVLLYCVCGAGKTELVARSIAAMLAQRRKVCFAIPRRQVVLELRERLAGWFPKAKVTAVCGGYTQETDGDLIVCTTQVSLRKHCREWRSSRYPKIPTASGSVCLPHQYACQTAHNHSCLCHPEQGCCLSTSVPKAGGSTRGCCLSHTGISESAEKSFP